MAPTDKVISYGDYIVRESDVTILKENEWLNDTLIGKQNFFIIFVKFIDFFIKLMQMSMYKGSILSIFSTHHAQVLMTTNRLEMGEVAVLN